MIVTARLIRRGCADGLVEIRDDVPLGKEYRIDTESIRELRCYNTVQHVYFRAMAVRTEGPAKWMFTDLLAWDGKPTA